MEKTAPKMSNGKLCFLGLVALSALTFFGFHGCSREWKEGETTVRERITLTTKEGSASGPKNYILRRQEYSLFPYEEKKLIRYEYFAGNEKMQPRVLISVQDFSRKPQFHFYDLIDDNADGRLDLIAYTTGLGPFLRKIVFKPLTEKATLPDIIEEAVDEKLGKNTDYAYYLWKHDQEIKIPTHASKGLWAQQVYIFVSEELNVKEFHKQWLKEYHGAKNV